MELARALDELYAGTPDQFTSRRDAIVKEMKAAGDKDAAAQLAKRRKPTQVAYVLNQLARKHPDEVASFVDVGRELARAHRKTLRGGGGAELAKAIAAQRTAVKELTALVGDVVNELAHDAVAIGDATLAEVAGALQAALVDPAAAAALEEGQLEKAPEAPDASMFGFGEAIVARPERTDETEPAPQHARPERRAPTSRQRPRRDKDKTPETKAQETKAQETKAQETKAQETKETAAERRAREREERARAKAEREREKREREQERAQEREQERERARAAREREQEELADLADAAERAEQIAKERAATAQELGDEAERLQKAARALAAQAHLAQQEAERAAAEAREARGRVPAKARRRKVR